jgi:hypothetical protein
VDVDAFCERILATSQRLGGDVVPNRVLRPSTLTQPFWDAQSAGRGHALLRHVQQQVSIVENLAASSMVDSTFKYLELGCGRGMLSLALAEVLPSCTLVLVDRAGVRRKVR